MIGRACGPGLTVGRIDVKKVVICDEHGGFSLSRAAFIKLRELGNEHALAEPDIGEMWPDGSGPRKSYGVEGFGRDIPRTDPGLVAVVEELGQDAAGSLCHLRVVEIPNDVEWNIEEYDGLEWVAEKHRTWG
jgi:hypothetical protein